MEDKDGYVFNVALPVFKYKTSNSDPFATAKNDVTGAIEQGRRQLKALDIETDGLQFEALFHTLDSCSIAHANARFKVTVIGPAKVIADVKKIWESNLA